MRTHFLKHAKITARADIAAGLAFGKSLLHKRSAS